VTAPLDVLCMGEALWDLAPPRGQTFAAARSLRFRPGGGAVNVALALARLGWKAGLAATVGADALGDALTSQLAARGVGTALVQRAPPRTGLVFVEDTRSSAKIVAYRQADEPVPQLLPGWNARALLLTGLWPSEAQSARFGAAAREARRQEARVLVDLNARPRMWRGHAGATAPAWLAEASVVKASEEDLATMGLDEATLRAAMNPSAVLVVTAGAGAARAVGPFGEVERAPVPAADLGATKAVGAGDLFMAGIFDAILRGDRADAAFWESTLRRGHTLARRATRALPGR